MMNTMSNKKKREIKNGRETESGLNFMSDLFCKDTKTPSE